MCDNPIQTIVELFGGQTALARRLGCTQATVWYWVQQREVNPRRMTQIIEVGEQLDPPVLLEPSDFFPPRRERKRRKSS